ncbi:MAG: PDZ domain-containing protein [Fimbriimonadaceae bacterium]
MKLRFRMILLSVGLAIAALGSAQSTPPAQEELTAETKAGVLSGIEQILKERAFVPGLDFNKWDELVEKNKENFDKANDERSFVNSVNRALREFGISHVGLRTPRAATTRRTGRTSGMGMSTTKVDDGLRITQVVEESPAHQAGLVVGDVILTINGQKAEDLNALPTQEGQPATLTIRDAAGDERTVPIVAGQYRTARKDTLNWLDDKTAVMRINSFSNGYNRSQDMVKEANDKKGIADY